MVDRELTFSHPEMVRMLKYDFVPVAIDQWYHRRQQDAEGQFYRNIAGQGPRRDFNSTTQGRYVCTADGQLLGYNNNRGPERVMKIMKEALEQLKQSPASKIAPIERGEADQKYVRNPPENGLMLRVHAKILNGYKPTENWTKVFHGVVSRDNAWFLEPEKKQLIEWISDGGELPAKLARRIARFHLIDNTRGEPPRWSTSEIKSLKMEISPEGIITGQFHLETSDQQRGYVGDMFGLAATDGTEIQRFDLVAKGQFWGQGRHTQFAPQGKFPLVVAFRIADGSDPSDLILPHGGKGWLQGYYQ